MNKDTVTIAGPGLLEIYEARVNRYRYIDVYQIHRIQDFDTYFQLKMLNHADPIPVGYSLDQFRLLVRRSLCLSKEQLGEELGLDLLGALP